MFLSQQIHHILYNILIRFFRIFRWSSPRHLSLSRTSLFKEINITFGEPIHIIFLSIWGHLSRFFSFSLFNFILLYFPDVFKEFGICEWRKMLYSMGNGVWRFNIWSFNLRLNKEAVLAGILINFHFLDIDDMVFFIFL